MPGWIGKDHCHVVHSRVFQDACGKILEVYTTTAGAGSIKFEIGLKHFSCSYFR